MTLELKVFTKSSRECLVKKDGILKAYVKAAPDKGKANRALVELIAREYKVKKNEVTIVSGLSSRNKTVKVGK